MAVQYTNSSTFSKATGSNTAIAARRFVEIHTDGNVRVPTAAQSKRVIGVTENEWDNDSSRVEANLLNYGGILEVDSGAAVPLGSYVTNDDEGKAVVATSGQRYFGFAVKAASGADEQVEVLFVTNGGTV